MAQGKCRLQEEKSLIDNKRKDKAQLSETQNAHTTRERKIQFFCLAFRLG